MRKYDRLLCYQMQEGELEALGNVLNGAKNRITNLYANRPESLEEEVAAYRKDIPHLITYIDVLTDNLRMAVERIERINNKTDTNAKKKWTKDEDNLLIDVVCSEKWTPLQISTIFGRTPAAINTRVSYLVGVQKLDRKVAGHFVGEMDGKEVRATIKGTVFKGEKK